MQSRDIAHQIIEAVSGDASGGIQINAGKAFHDLGVVGDRIIRYNGLAVTFYFHVLGIVFPDRDGRIDHLGDDHHLCFDLFFDFLLSGGQFIDPVGILRDLCLDSLGFFLLPLLHEAADLLAELVAVCTQRFHFTLDLAVLAVECDDFIDQRKLGILEFLSDVLFDQFGIFPDKLNV